MTPLELSHPVYHNEDKARAHLEMAFVVVAGLWWIDPE